MNSHQWQQHVITSSQTVVQENRHSLLCLEDDNGLPNLEALKNIYQEVAQQLLNSRDRYVKKHHNQQRSESPVQAGDLILIKDNTAKSFEPLYKGNYRVVKVHGNNVEI